MAAISERTLSMLRPDKILFKGWLKKEGDVHRSWKKRYFVLVGDHLYYFPSEKPSAGPKGLIFLADREIRDLDPKKVKGAEFGFELHREDDRCYYLLSTNAKEREEWCKWIMYSKYRKYALLLARFWRFRTRFRKRWRAAIVIQRAVRGYLAKREAERRRKAIITIQAAWRSYLARKKVAQFINAVVTIQRNLRMLRDRKTFVKKRKAAIKIQSSFRGHAARQYCELLTLQRSAEEEMGVLVESEIDRKQEEERFGAASLVIQRHVRGYLERMRFAKIQKDLVRREKIARECLSTEESYFLSLKTLKDVFVDGLKGEAKYQFVGDHWSEMSAVLAPEELEMVFSNVHEIIFQHEVIYHSLKARMDEWKIQMPLGDIFIGLASFIPSVYTSYVNNFDRSMGTVLALGKKKPLFRKFLEEQLENERTRGLDLSAYLIMPVQRIPRYVLLLADLVKHTPPMLRDREVLVSALEMIQETADYVNRCKGNAENAVKIVQIQNSIAGAKCPNLSMDGKFARVFLHEGMMKKLPSGGNIGKSHTRHFFLFSDIAIYCEKRLIPKGGKRYDYKGCIPIEMASVKPHYDKDVPHGFEIYTNKGKFVLFADDEKTKQVWMEKIAAAVDAYHRQLFNMEGVEVEEGTFRHDRQGLPQREDNASNCSVQSSSEPAWPGIPNR